MGTPPSYATAPDIQPTARAEALAIETNSIALLNRIAKLEAQQEKILRALFNLVDQTDPACPFGIALTMAELT